MSNPVFSPEFFEEVLSSEWTGRERFQGASGFSFDTRTLESGDVFVALQTGARDGHDFLEKAAEAGASCALVSDVRPKLSLPQMQVDDTLAALQKLGAFGALTIGVSNGIFSPLAMGVAFFDLASGLLMGGYLFLIRNESERAFHLL